MISASPDAPRCPQCQHPVILNRVDCRGCGRPYHELCLKRGCTNGPGCGTGSAARASGPGKWLAFPFLAATVGLGAAYFRWRARVTASPLFAPALATGLAGMVAALKIGDSPPEGAKCRVGRVGGWSLLVASLAAAAIAGTGREVPFTPHLTALGAAGAGLAVLGLALDRDRRPAMLHVLLAAHLYLVAAIVLTPGFPGAMLARVKSGGATGGGLAPAGGAGGGGLGSVLGLGGGTPAVAIKGVMSVGGRKQAMTDTGSFGIGDTIPGAGVVQSITDDEVAVRQAGGQVTKYPVPH